jgi:hypothetical protein
MTTQKAIELRNLNDKINKLREAQRTGNRTTISAAVEEVDKAIKSESSGRPAYDRPDEPDKAPGRDSESDLSDPISLNYGRDRQMPMNISTGTAHGRNSEADVFYNDAGQVPASNAARQEAMKAAAVREPYSENAWQQLVTRVMGTMPRVDRATVEQHLMADGDVSAWRHAGFNPRPEPAAAGAVTGGSQLSREDRAIREHSIQVQYRARQLGNTQEANEATAIARMMDLGRTRIDAMRLLGIVRGANYRGTGSAGEEALETGTNLDQNGFYSDPSTWSFKMSMGDDLSFGDDIIPTGPVGGGGDRVPTTAQGVFNRFSTEGYGARNSQQAFSQAVTDLALVEENGAQIGPERAYNMMQNHINILRIDMDDPISPLAQRDQPTISDPLTNLLALEKEDQGALFRDYLDRTTSPTTPAAFRQYRAAQEPVYQNIYSQLQGFGDIPTPELGGGSLANTYSGFLEAQQGGIGVVTPERRRELAMRANTLLGNTGISDFDPARVYQSQIAQSPDIQAQFLRQGSLPYAPAQARTTLQNEWQRATDAYKIALARGGIGPENQMPMEDTLLRRGAANRFSPYGLTEFYRGYGR